MPFQDIDEVTPIELQRPAPTSVEKLLRRIFLEDWSLKLLSLAIAIVLWLLVTGQNEPVTAHVSVQLNFIRPQSLEISNDPPRAVDVMLTGSRNKLDDLTSLDLVATVDISDQRAGERVLRLADKAQIALPQGIKVDGFQPSAIPIRLEPILERQVPIEPKFEGKPADGFEVYAAQPSKGSVMVRGPESRVNALQKVVTETIWLAGHKETFTAKNLALDVPDPKIDVLEPVVNVDVEIGEQRTEKNISGVNVSTATGGKVQPETTSVTLLGATSLLDSLKPEDIKIVLDAVGQNLEPRLELPQPLKGKVVLKSVHPSKFVPLR
ncbi:MAG TPA: CdaR family protein [Pyrinomonadaceae bacterium]|jgi:YbbR domain-containing protein|nr:CdaR family protein [Pyrinomonadaceae bacterium]